MKEFKRVLRFIIVTITVFVFLSLLLNIKGYSEGEAFEFSLIGSLSGLDSNLLIFLGVLSLILFILIIVYVILIFYQYKKNEFENKITGLKRERDEILAIVSRIAQPEKDKAEHKRDCSEITSSQSYIDQKEVFKTMESKLDKIIELLSGNQGQ